ncbi:MAG: signal peptidase I [Lachnospiraceae bacterium]|nr:signal peptidase I [Lachnospiraceae bacterium]
MKALKGFFEFVLYVAVVLVITFLLVKFVAQRTEVFGTSMVPTLQSGDQLIADKITYRFRDPERFDIIVFPYRMEEKTYYIKRIIGLPGETVRIDLDGTIYIDGQPLSETYGKDPITDPGLAIDELTLADDEYFCLGDNRAVSKDSRYGDVGNIKRREIIGRAWLRIYPFSEFGILKHQ